MKFKINGAKDKDAVKKYLDTLKEGKIYNVTIALHREKRSFDQNSLMWLWLSCISSDTGQDKDSLHAFFKQKYLGFEHRQIMGQTVYYERTTKGLDTKQFTAYLEKIHAFVSTELGIELPNPEDQYWEQFHEQYNNYI